MLDPRVRGQAELIDEIKASHLFDEHFYAAARYARATGMEPIEHYMRVGEALNIAPSSKFDPHFYVHTYPDTASYGLPLLLHYIRHGKSEGRLPIAVSTVSTASVMDLSDQEAIARSGLFDEEHYAGAGEARQTGITSIEHYLQVGESRGLAPSTGFDPAYYALRYPDVASTGGNLLMHYLRHGLYEGRNALPASKTVFCPAIKDPKPSTIVFIVHDSTITGAPILAWNCIRRMKEDFNVVVLLIRGSGPVKPALQAEAAALITLPDEFVPHYAEASSVAQRLVAEYAPEFVIANTSETREFGVAFEKAGVPVVALIHEFSASVRPPGCLHELLTTASHIVFSADIVARSFLADYDYLPGRPVKVLPQGRCALPVVASARENDTARLDAIPSEGRCLVIGVGTITPRKGVDAFIAVAAAAKRLGSKATLTFIWIGKSFDFDIGHKDLLEEQIDRSGLRGEILFPGEFEDLAPVYERADMYFLSSRLDPLPNTAIDAAFSGLPVVCFDGASGIADMWSEDQALKELVVPYLDIEAAARTIVVLADNEARRTAASEAVKTFAAAHFDMDEYVSKIVALGSAASAAVRQMDGDREVILNADLFNASLFEGRPATGEDKPFALHKYLNTCRIATPCSSPMADLLVRRPVEGFHPLIYAAFKEDFDDTSSENPLAHYIRSDRPQGAWNHEVIRPDAAHVFTRDAARIAIHGHFHYPELFEEFAELVERNAMRPDLYLTTSSEDGAAQLRKAVKAIDCGTATVTVVPNRGRDIGALLSAYPYSLFEPYDVLGHFHGKRSPHIDPAVGDRWRHFIYDHLLGFKSPMMSQIVSRLIADKGLGLVFPEDPHLNGWNHNASIANELARRAGIKLPLPVHFDFAHGTMFWAKPPALKALFDMNLTWSDYPDEPLPIDGTILHALERLVTHSAAQAGFRYASVYTGERWR